MKRAIFIIPFIMLLSTCTKDIGGADLCFQEDVLPIFISNCTMAGCHNGQGHAPYDFTSYEGIVAGVVAKHPLRSEVYKAIRGKNPSMPQKPYSKLSSKDVNAIKLWINLGAHNTSNCKSCDTTKYTYTTRIEAIMQLWCTGCHNTSSAAGGYNLSNYNGVVASQSNGKLLLSIRHQSGALAMPQSGGQLGSCDIDAIQKWVSQGFPN